eukprot:GILK01003762.1.p1 GENE.GILK01003762.1~~GILK01003762.1.p1  ORF type:complete len:338 (-),score=23.92 GILK01003762.1:91-1104(-)
MADDEGQQQESGVDRAAQKAKKRAKSQSYYKQRQSFRKCRRMSKSFPEGALMLLIQSSHDVWHTWRSNNTDDTMITQIMSQHFNQRVTSIDANGRISMSSAGSSDEAKPPRKRKATHILRSEVRQLTKQKFPSVIWTRADTKPPNWPITSFGDINKLSAADLRTLQAFLTDAPSSGQHLISDSVTSSDVPPIAARDELPTIEAASAVAVVANETVSYGDIMITAAMASADVALPNSNNVIRSASPALAASLTLDPVSKDGSTRGQVFAIGTTFEKSFGRHGRHKGVVVAYNKPYYKVFYPADNDVEDLNSRELSELMYGKQTKSKRARNNDTKTIHT